MKKILYLFLVLVVLGILLFFSSKEKSVSKILPVSNINYVQLAGVTLKVDVVSTPEARAQGLSGRLSLAPDTGMLFVFEKPDAYSFWMKDMNFPIDMIWIGEDMKITYIKKNATPESYPEGFGPKEKTSKYVLEVHSLFSDKYNLKLQDRVKFLP